MKELFLLATLVGAPDALHNAPNMSEPNTQVAVTCFRTGERRSGLNKICYYDCLGSAYAITLKGFQLCPYTINN